MQSPQGMESWGGTHFRAHLPVPRLTTTPRSSESFFMMMAARILRPSKEGWKLLVRALKHRWLSMAIWSWKVLPVRGSCGDRSPCQGHRASPASTMLQAGRGGRVPLDSWVIFSPSGTSIPALWRLILKLRDSPQDSNLRADSTQIGVSRTPKKREHQK